MKKYIYLFLLGIFITLPSCQEPEPEEYEIIIDWIWENMTDIYLWADEVDKSLYPTSETDPEAFFNSILNSEDRFSWIVNDHQELLNSFDNIELSSGISPYFLRLNEAGDIIAAVEFVTKGSPADLAGIKRGEIIIAINESKLTIENYRELFFAENQTLEFGNFVNGQLIATGKKVSLTAAVVETNPVHYTEIIQHASHDIGYLVYTNFRFGPNDKWLDSLNHVLLDFREKGINDIILDMRYNLGGYASVAQHLASILAPAEVPTGNNIFIKFEWNEVYQDYIIREEGRNSPNLVVPFDDSPPFNMDLSTVYILTSWHTASAPELLIIGLDPYMDVVQIGEATNGKFYASITIPDSEDPPRHNWAMQPIVARYTSATGFTGFKDGIQPDIEIPDNILNAKPFGDLSDPILARALEEITGESPIARKAASELPNYTPLPDPMRDRQRNTIQLDVQRLKK